MRIPLPLLALVVLFFCKAIFLALFVNPLWSVSDESAHLAYVQDIAEGRGLPVLGKTLLSPEITEACFKTQKPYKNWIAQHPPLYYLLAAIPYKIGMFFTDNLEILFRLPRILSALSGALVLCVAWRIAILCDSPKITAISFSTFIGFIPNVTHLSSGTTHEMLLLLLVMITAMFWLKFIKDNNILDAYLSFIFLALAIMTKITALLLLPFLVISTLIEMNGVFKRRFLHTAGILCSGMFFPCLWFLRNLYYFGNPFPDNTTISSGKPVLLKETVFDFFHKFPLIDDVIKQSLGYFGWRFSNAELKMIVIQNDLLCVYSIMLFFLVGIVFCFVIYKSHFPTELLFHSSTYYAIMKTVLCSFSACAAFYIYENSIIEPKFSSFSWIRILLASLFFFSAIFGIQMCFSKKTYERVVEYALLISILFIFFVFIHGYSKYLVEGNSAWVAGRYFYPVLPFLFIAINIAAPRWMSKIFLLFAIIAAITEFLTYSTRVLPFYFQL